MLLHKNKKLKLGTLTSFYLVWYGIERFFVESLRTDSLMLGSFKIAQIVSLVFVIAGIILCVLSLKKWKKNYWEETYEK